MSKADVNMFSGWVFFPSLVQANTLRFLLVIHYRSVWEMLKYTFNGDLDEDKVITEDG